MASVRSGPGALLLGDTRRTADRFLLVAGAVFIALPLLRASVGRDVNTILQSDLVYASAVALTLVVAGGHAYRNRGLFTSVVCAYLVLAGYFLGGWIALGRTGSGSVLPEYALLPAVLGIPLGGGAFVLGWGARYAVRRMAGA
ncbi:MAG: hypothetical protein ABEJ68_08965 [Halobacteriaceae archaeon]